MRTPVLYTIGYGGKVPKAFYAALPADALVIDVRARPVGYLHEYSYNGLRRNLGERYKWYEALGNISGRADEWLSPKPEFVDSALNAVARMVTKERPVVLLCAEKRPADCHRRLVAEAIAARVPGLEVRHL